MPLYYPQGAAINITGNTAGNAALVSRGSLYLSGGNNITLSQSTAAGGNTIVVSGGAGGGGVTMRGWYPYQLVFSSNTSYGNGTMQLFPLFAPQYVTATAVQQAAFVSITSSSNLSNSASLTLSIGVFNFTNSTQLSLLTSGSTVYSLTVTSSAGYGNYTGVRLLNVPMNVNMSPGQYVVGLWSSTSGNNGSVGVGNMINTALISNVIFSGSWGSNYASRTQVFPGWGLYSTSFGTAMPSTIALSAVTVTLAGAACKIPHLQFPQF